ncbi:hypothetical protein [Streptobacillus moniliformis]|uniref:Uncharacterized protein n=2 Tax=Streptobacillus moniliformis TaxID=34105 RepID=D1AW60_STRM9|nr:hypothetical protein [Streptobacillus moniliformis]ACZ00536.1 hypothetical protein Smon_0039 [Streptobacillus moniliformis DSM 12112]AVL43046.1 hypothetical protein CEP89_04050 [Streptobacillus moniliformis]QXW65304.1 hypothetical protein KX935_05740 [Streptobacillus moniliformis]SQA12817.1 Uncharacterised protein [Streptobacillus moniliformis]
MKKIFIAIMILLSFNSFSMIDIEDGLAELNNIKKELIIKYKKVMNIDFSDVSEKSTNELRIFNETLYLKFLSKYVFDVTDVKMYSSKNVNNLVIFADTPIEKDDFDSIYSIIAKKENDKRLKLLQVPSSSTKNIIIQEKSSERD